MFSFCSADSKMTMNQSKMIHGPIVAGLPFQKSMKKF